MLKRYQSWAKTYPLWDWLLTASVFIVIMLSGFFVVPGPKKPGFAMWLVYIALSQPTISLVNRFSDERRQSHSVSPEQEHGVGLLALLSSLCSIGAFGVCLLEKRLHLSIDISVVALAIFGGSALLSLVLGYAARHSWAGRWGFRLTVGWLAVMLGMAVVMMLWRGFTHT